MPDVGFRFRAYADEQTLGALKAQLTLACEIYNTLRLADIHSYKRDGRRLTRNELRQLALDLRKRDDEYQQLYSQVVQQIADRFYDAKRRFLEGISRFPREKRAHRYHSLVYPQSGWKVLEAREIGIGGGSKNKKRKVTLELSKLGIFKVIVHRDFPLEDVRRVIVKLAPSGRVYITFVVDHEFQFPQSPRTKANRAVAMDVGVEKLLTTSDGGYVPNPRSYERALEEVRRLQRSLSRKRFLSNNWFRARIKLARAYEHMVNMRRDIYMKLGKWFSDNYDVIVMEDIDVKELVGKAYRRLRMRLQDAAFHELRSILKHQIEKYGKTFILVDPAFTSKTCARCGYVREDLALSDRVFICPRCGWAADRDYNASLNILRRSGWEPPLEPVELRPLPAFSGQGGAMKREAPSARAG